MMKKHSSTYKTFDVVLVPFPFADQFLFKNRPAVVISATDFYSKTGHCLVAMITSAHHNPWPLDVGLFDPNHCNLKAMSIVRMKFTTIDNNLIKANIGKLALVDIKSLRRSLKHIFKEISE